MTDRILLRPGTEDLSGRTYGRLAVLYPVERTAYRHVRYLCRCSCGTLRRFFGANLKNGHTQSCGCLYLDRLNQSAPKETVACATPLQPAI